MNLRIWALVMVLLLGACTQDKKTVSSQQYTCPMHPQIMSPEPGTCPICKMDLVPVNATGGKNELMLSESQMQLANVRTMKVGKGSFRASKLLNARLVNDPEQTEVISSRYPGRIEKLFVRATGEALRAGQPVLQIYSEELLTLQQDYLLQVKQQRAFPGEKIYADLMKAAKDRLLLYGVSQSQLQQLVQAGKPSPVMTVYARRSGIVKEIQVTEGSYVAEGSPILRLENLSSLWVEADLYPSEAGKVKRGTTVRVNVAGFQEPLSMKIDFIAPQLNPGTQLLTIRGSINNSGGQLQPGMQATVELPSDVASAAVRLPVDAIIRKESGAHVWVKTGKDTFAPRQVTTGAEDSEQIVINSGIREGDEVVISGGYLLYSEFILKKGSDPTLVHNH